MFIGYSSRYKSDKILMICVQIILEKQIKGNDDDARANSDNNDSSTNIETISIIQKK